MTNISGRCVFLIRRLEDPAEEVDRLVERVESDGGFEFGPKGVEDFIAGRGRARPSDQVAEQGEDLPPDRRPFNVAGTDSDGDATLIFNDDYWRQSPSECLA